MVLFDLLWFMKILSTSNENCGMYRTGILTDEHQTFIFIAWHI